MDDPTPRTFARFGRGCTLLGLVLCVAGVGLPAAAANFSVNSTRDLGDNSHGDSQCWTGGWVQIGLFGVYECTLRAAIEETNALSTGTDVIRFWSGLTPSADNAIWIVPGRRLPDITSPLVIDGTTATGYGAGNPAGHPTVLLYGGLVASAWEGSGLRLRESADGSEIRGLAITAWEHHGIYVDGADNVVIEENRIGHRPGSTVDGNTLDGIHVSPASSGTRIGDDFNALTGFQPAGNLISGNGGSGIVTGGNNTKIAGNWIGTTASGGWAPTWSNAQYGIYVHDMGAHAVEVGRREGLAGGGHAVSGNVIVGSGMGGITVEDTNDTEIWGNAIGITPSGGFPYGNGTNEGIDLRTGGVTVGEDGPGRNVIVGHSGPGIVVGNMAFPLASGNQIVGNHIGINSLSPFPGGNDGSGVVINNADATLIRANMIGDNGGDGVHIANGSFNTLFANYIGTDASGANLRNDGDGIYVGDHANRIGAASDGNIIGWNVAGIAIPPNVWDTAILGNYIGADPAGRDVHNRAYGITNEGHRTVIGDGTPGAGNVIGFNDFAGIQIWANSSESTVHGNWIGTNAAGMDLGQRGMGLSISGSMDNTIGASHYAPESALPTMRNVIAFNDDEGIRLTDLGGPGQRNTFRANELFANGAAPIDLVGAGANDADDTDTGVNNLQNSPEIDIANTSFDPVQNRVGLHYLVDSDPAHSTYPILIDFYELAADGVSPGRWLGAEAYEANEAGTLATVTLVPSIALSTSDSILAIATDDDGNSSEPGNTVFLPEPSLAMSTVAGAAWLLGIARRRRDD